VIPKTSNRRILVVDDNPSIQADYRRILGAKESTPAALADARAAFFGTAPEAGERAQESNPGFELDAAHQGDEGLERVREALAQKRPYALAFIDVRMPPGIDGVETAARIWDLDPQMQVVICTAFADYSWEDLGRLLGRSDRLLILKKPFDPIEVVQLATALSEKWNSATRERESTAELRRAEQSARAYSASLTTINRTLETAMAAAESTSSSKSRLLARFASILQAGGDALAAALELAQEPGLETARRQRVLDEARERCDELRRAAHNLGLEAGLDLGELHPQPAPFHPGELLDRVAQRWRPRAEGRGLRVVGASVGALPLELRGDVALVEGILDSLAHNALRFSTEGTIRIEAWMPVPEESEEPAIVFCVTDAGPGIAAEAQPQVFDVFAHAQLQSADERGAHVSLHTARRLARFLGGDLELESAPGSGARFQLRLPVGDLSGTTLAVHPHGALPSAAKSAPVEGARPPAPPG
jgi:two-component system, sensor histidine kinase and response regulator